MVDGLTETLEVADESHHLQGQRGQAHQRVDGEPPLEWLQEQVGGYIEKYPMLPVTVWVNEVGSLHNLKPNPHAEELLGVPIRGDFVVLEG